MSKYAASRFLRILLLALVVLVIAYLALRARRPHVADGVPWLKWFGQPAHVPTIAIVVALIALLCVLSYRSRRGVGAPIVIVLGLVTTSMVLAMASYWDCHNDKHPTFFTPLAWSLSLLQGGVDDRQLDGQTCTLDSPIALEIARLSAIAAIFVGVLGAAIALFQSQFDRVRARFAHSVIAIVGIDDDAQSMVSAIVKTLDKRSRVVLITDSPDRPCISQSRREGAAVVALDADDSNTLKPLRLWRRLDRLYLLSADPTTNLIRLGAIGQQLSTVTAKQRIPLIVRIDDPWQAEAWRATQFSGLETRWAVDTVGKYEVTARRLLDQIIGERHATRVIVCGTSPLTLALSAEMPQRQRERTYSHSDDHTPLTLTIVGTKAEEYRQDHGPGGDRPGAEIHQVPIDVVCVEPSVPVIAGVISGGNEAVVFVDDASGETAVDTTVATRLAARFPELPIFAWDPSARATSYRLPIVGQLRTYRLAMDLPNGQAHDAWERAAMLIHERYSRTNDNGSASTRPWAELDEFYRGSNRRQVSNALWMVESIGEHTWNTGDSHATPVPDMSGRAPLEQLALLGFDRDAAMAMARAEHEDWCRYLRRGGWRHGPEADENRRRHPGLVRWAEVEADPKLLETSLDSLATTLLGLAHLGYRSRPIWQKFRRTGTVTAERRSAPWTWASSSGDIMRADAGDWSVSDDDAAGWSVRDDIFRSTYRHITQNLWQRTGIVRARQVCAVETVPTLEGAVTAEPGDWVVRGQQDDQWVMSGDQFARRYEGPVTSSDGDRDARMETL